MVDHQLNGSPVDHQLNGSPVDHFYSPLDLFQK
jgi:hypothetical protein